MGDYRYLLLFFAFVVLILIITLFCNNILLISHSLPFGVNTGRSGVSLYFVIADIGKIAGIIYIIVVLIRRCKFRILFAAIIFRVCGCHFTCLMSWLFTVLLRLLVFLLQLIFVLWFTLISLNLIYCWWYRTPRSNWSFVFLFNDVIIIIYILLNYLLLRLVLILLFFLRLLLLKLRIVIKILTCYFMGYEITLILFFTRRLRGCFCGAIRFGRNHFFWLINSFIYGIF